MSTRNMELALRIKADVASANAKMEQFNNTIEATGEVVKQSASAWQETASAQDAAMKNYHRLQQAAEQLAAAEAQAAEQAKKTNSENEKKNTSLQKLMGALDKTQKALADLDRQELELNKHFREGRIDLETYNSALAKIQSKRNSLSNLANDAKKSTNEVSKLTKAIRGVSGALATIVTGYGLVNLGKSVIDASAQWQKAQTVLRVATGSAAKAAQELSYVRTVSRDLSLELLSTAGSYAKLLSVAKGSPAIAQELKYIFESINKTGAALQIAPSGMQTVLTAYERMINKGKVKLIDLQQIATHVPGTFEKAAKALGTNTTQLTEWINKGLIPASEFLPRFSDELNKSLGDTVQNSTTNLQAKLIDLKNVWTELKLEAADAGFIDSYTEAVKALADVLKDPAVQEGFNTLIKAMGQTAGYAAKGIGNISNMTRFIAEEFASSGGNVASDDIARLEQYVTDYENEINRLKSVVTHIQQPGNIGFIDKLLGRGVDDQVEHGKKNIKALEDELQKLKALRDDFYNSKKPTTVAAEPIDELVEQYKSAKENLAEVQKEILEGNKDLDSSLAQIRFDDATDAVKTYCSELENTFKDRNATLVLLQDAYLKEMKNLSNEEKAFRQEEIANAKSYLAQLTTELDKYKNLLNTSTARPAFVPTEKPKKTRKTAKSAEQKKSDEQEKYVKNLEKQAATLGMSTAQVRQYELAEKNLTGQLAERAKAALEAMTATEKLAHVTTNKSMQAELLRVAGKDYEADLLELEIKFNEATKNLKKEGNEAGLALAQQLFDTGKFKAKIDAVQAQIEKAFQNQSIQEQSIQAQVTAGQITQYEGQKRLTALHKQTAAIIEQYVPELEKAASAPGVMSDQIANYAANVKNQLLLLKTTTSELENAFKNGLQNGIQSSLDGLVKGTMNLQEALLNLVNSIASAMANIAVQQLAEQWTSGLMSSLGNLGSMLGIGGGAASAATDTAGKTAEAAASQAVASASTTAASGIMGLSTAATLATAALQAVAGQQAASGGANMLAIAAATGGHIRGVGTGTSDSIPAYLSNDEFVTRSAVIRQPGALSFAKDFNRYGMAALGMWTNRIGHSTGGLAGIPAPNMPTPSYTGLKPSSNSAASTTVKNAVNLTVVDDPSRIIGTAFGEAGMDQFILEISRNPQRFKSALQL